MPSESDSGRRAAALRVVLFYAVFSSLWILLSDTAVYALLSDPLLGRWASIAKGWLFVLVTSGLLYLMVRRLLEQLHASEAQRNDALSRAEQQQRQLLEQTVTQRTQALSDALERVRVSEERFDLAMAATRDGIWDWDIPSGQSHVNTAYAAMLGFTPDELGQRIESCWLALLHTDERESVHREVMERLAASGLYRIEYRLRCKEGHYKWILCRGMAVTRDSQGRPLRAVGTHVDLSERKRQETELREARDAAEAANRAKSTFLANMSHELRTPLNGIMGMTALALQRAEDHKLRAHLERIDEASHRLLKLVNDLLDISNIEAGRFALEPCDFKLIDVLHRVMNACRKQAARKGLRLFVKAPDVAAVELRGDPERLVQVLLKLADNAVKFTEQGSITLRVRQLDHGADGVLLRFEVEDTGIGIAPEAMTRLFAAFEQGDKSATRRHSGAGLGLAIARRLVQMMGGEIGIEQGSDGQGCKFWFTARLGHAGAAVPEARTEVPASEALKRRLGGQRVLLADYEPLGRLVSLGLLEQAGLEVDLADDGAQVIEMAARTPYALILLDLQMPRIDSLQAARAIRRLPAHAGTPIIAMSDRTLNDEDRRACREAGIVEQIGKPVDPCGLHAALNERQP